MTLTGLFYEYIDQVSYTRVVSLGFSVEKYLTIETNVISIIQVAQTQNANSSR